MRSALSAASELSSAATHRAVMQRLDTSLDAIAASLPRNSHIVYLDIPIHFNVGDLLINRGTEVFFKRMAYTVHARLTLEDLCEFSTESSEALQLRGRAVRLLESMPQDVAIVMHGGGNFGDLYPKHHLMREAIIKKFAGRLIVMLPQSMHFSSQGKAEASLDQLARHPNLHLYFRDYESTQLASSRGISKVFLSPDMAHALRPIGETRVKDADAGEGTICLRRLDEEGTAWQAPGANRTECDWDMLIRKSHNMGNRLVLEMMRRQVDPTMRIPISIWYFVTKRIVADAVQLFIDHESVVTDRLHAVILAALLDRPVAYTDNSYGKLSRYSAAFLSDSPYVRPL